MADLKERRRRWRGPALGGPLQRGARFCFAAHDGEASTARLTEWCRPELVGGRVKKWHLSNQERALHSIGARKVRRDGPRRQSRSRGNAQKAKHAPSCPLLSLNNVTTYICTCSISVTCS